MSRIFVIHENAEWLPPFAEALAAEGVRVALASRSAEKLAAAAATIDGDPVTLTVDLADPASVDALVGDALAALGHVDILIANGGGQCRIESARIIGHGDQRYLACVKFW